MNQDSDNLSSNCSNSDNHKPDSVEDKRSRILSLREDWAVIPYIALILSGFIVSIVDFVYLQMHVFQLVYVIIGIPMLVFGAITRFLPRKSLTKAGFKNIWKTPYLQIVEDHRLVTDGYYKHIRHPIYLGEIATHVWMGYYTFKPLRAFIHDYGFSVSFDSNRSRGKDAH